MGLYSTCLVKLMGYPPISRMLNLFLALVCPGTPIVPRTWYLVLGTRYQPIKMMTFDLRRERERDEESGSLSRPPSSLPHMPHVGLPWVVCRSTEELPSTPTRTMTHISMCRIPIGPCTTQPYMLLSQRLGGDLPAPLHHEATQPAGVMGCAMFFYRAVSLSAYCPYA